jgi:two-component system, NtrC family, response regulator GlrR
LAIMQQALGDWSGAIRVLIVDDDGVLVRSLQRVLSLQGFEVEAALDGRTALNRLQTNDYDVMLLDLRMGSMDGMEVYSQAPPSRLPATIIHSAHVDLRTAVLATRAGVQDVMQKPVPEDVLAFRIRELAAERRASHQRALQTPQSGSEPEALLRLVGTSASAGELREHVHRVAQFRDVPVLIQGATGTGKELVAQAVHALTCPNEPFVSVNCAAVPEQLFESELFGHEAGAFTSARAQRVGLFEEAGNGTLFLDEIGEMPLALQAKLLRVLEVRQFRRVGSTRTRLFTARVVSATNRPLSSSLGGTLRPDLFFRLAGYAIRTPSLTDRLTDLPALAAHFISDFSVRHGVMGVSFSPEAMEALGAYSWPGNIRELRAVVENAAIVTRSGLIGRDHIEKALQARAADPSPDAWPQAILEPAIDAEEAPTKISGVMPVAIPRPLASTAESGAHRAPSLPALQRDMILRAFEESQHNLSKAAVDLGIPRSTLRARLRRYGVR